MDQVKLLSLLRTRYGEFTVIENPATNVAWPTESFLSLGGMVSLLIKNEHQWELMFNSVQLFNLRFRDEAKEMFTSMAESEGIFLDIELSRRHSDMEAEFLEARILKAIADNEASTLTTERLSDKLIVWEKVT